MIKAVDAVSTTMNVVASVAEYRKYSTHDGGHFVAIWKLPKFS